MSINKIRFLGLLALFSICGCSNDLFLTHNGNMPSNERIAKVKVGDSKNQVISQLGSPSSVVSLDQNTWIYMSSDIKRVAFMAPKEVGRDVLTIEFDPKGKVENIKRLTKKDGVEVAVSEEKTDALGHQPGFFEKFFGGIGNYAPFPGIKDQM